MDNSISARDRIRFPLRHGFRWVVLAVAVACASATWVGAFESDDFNTCGVDPRWTFVDPLGDAAHAVEGTGSSDAVLRIDVPAGTAHDPWRTNNAPRLMQSASDVDFQVEVKFESPVQLRYQMQGILVEQDADDWMRFDVYSDGAAVRVFAATTTAGKSRSKSDVPVTTTWPMWMRVTRSGDSWTQEYSTDGLAWTTTASFSHAVTVSAVGVFAGNAGQGGTYPAHTARFDYAFDTAAPVAPEDGTPPGPGSTLTVTTVGGGTVEVDPDQTAYYCNETVTLTAQPSSGGSFVGWSGDLTGSANPETIVMDADKSVTATFEQDLIPPVISNVQVEPGDTWATITWDTDEPSTSRVDYGESSSYELGFVEDPTLVTSHSVTLTGLTPETLYHYSVTSADAGGFSSTTADDTFTTTATPAAAFESDDFNTCGPDPRWTFVDPRGDSTHRIDGTGSGDATLVIDLPAGVSHDAWGTNNSARLMQPAVDIDFQAEIKFDSPVAARYQIQGLLVEQDGDDWLRFDVYADNNFVRMFSATTTAGKSRARIDVPITASWPLWMRVTRTGDTWTQEYSTDGTTWTTAGSYAYALAVTAVGPFAGNAGANPAHSARFDYVFEASAPIVPEDGTAPGPGYTLTVDTVGGGTVAIDPDQAVYYCGETVTLTAQPDAGGQFVGWSGDLTGSANPETIDMIADRFVTATFDVDSAAPVISNVAVDPTDTTATITWTTDEPATSRVDYGETSSYELGFVEDPTLVTSHSVTLTGLTPETLYHYSVTSADSGGLSSSTPDDTFTTTATPPGPFESDDFNRCAIEDRWTFVDPSGNASYEVEGLGTPDARLRIDVPAGTSHDAWHVNGSVRLMQPAGDTDFRADVKFESPVSARFQMQGLLVEQDADDWLRFDVYSDGKQVYAFSASTVGGSSSTRINVPITPTWPLWMRVTRTGNTWRQEFSTDGAQWSSVGSYARTMTVTAIGPFAGNAGANPSHTARFDYVFDADRPVVPEDGTPPGPGFTLTADAVGAGTVDVDPQRDLYYCDETVTLTAQPDTGAFFVGWSGDLTGSANPETIVMDADKTVTATFDQDTTPPVISGVVATPTETTATITWTTDEPATSRVDYGETAAYELGFVEDTALVTSHSITLTGLTPDTLYHYQVTSADAGGFSSSTADDTFTTDATAPDAFDSDDFNTCTTDARWTFVDPRGDSTHATVGAGSGDAALVIDVPGGGDHDAWNVNNAARLMQPSADADFQVEVKLDTPVTQANQFQGVLVEQDASNWIRFDVYSDGATTYLFAGTTVAGSSSARINLPIDPAWPMWLRVTRSGDVWSHEYSTDGATWVQGGSFAHALAVTAVGPMAGNTVGNPALTARFDYLFETSAPIVPEDGTPPGTGYALTVDVVGGGSVAVDPDQSLYYCNETVTLTATPNPGGTFLGWSGDLTGNANPDTIVMDADKAVTATFDVDTTPPVISNVAVDPTDTTATITWTTDEPSTSRVDYGETTSYELGFVENTSLVTSHSVTLTGLTPETLYHFFVTSENGAGLSSSTADDTFVTDPEPPPVPTTWTSDDFNAENLDLGTWSFVDPKADSRVSMTGTTDPEPSLRIHVPAGTKHDAWNALDAARVVQTVPDDDFEVEVKFESAVTQRYQIQGVLVEQDEDDWIRFDVYSDGSQVNLFAATTSAGSSSTRISLPILPSWPLWMRVRRAGDTWTQEYSNDGVSWNPAGSFSHAIAVTKAGLFAGNAGVAPAHTAQFDFAFDTTDPIVPEDGASPADTVGPYQHRRETGVADTYMWGRWATDEPATGRIEYGLTDAYELGSVEHLDLTYEHDLEVSGLTPETTYYFRYVSEDALGNVSSFEEISTTRSTAGLLPQIDVWYGDTQPFGHNGQPQTWVNVLGNVTDIDGIDTLTYSLNGGPPGTLLMGPDGARLASFGDFNAEIAYADLIDGLNEVRITATDTLGWTQEKVVWVDYASGNVWPQDTTVDWSTATSIQDVAQVIDGEWILEADGVRPTVFEYDRLIGLGDVTWDDYEVEMPLTVHWVDPEGYDSPSSGPGVGFGIRWTGHVTWNPAHQPRRGYWPTGALAWYRWITAGGLQAFELLGNEEKVADDDRTQPLVVGAEYRFKARVQTLTSTGGARYQFKYWKTSDPEPAGWPLSIDLGPEDPTQGAVILIAHEVDVTFGDVTVRSLPALP